MFITIDSDGEVSLNMILTFSRDHFYTNIQHVKTHYTNIQHMTTHYTDTMQSKITVLYTAGIKRWHQCVEKEGGYNEKSMELNFG